MTPLSFQVSLAARRLFLLTACLIAVLPLAVWPTGAAGSPANQFADRGAEHRLVSWTAANGFTARPWLVNAAASFGVCVPPGTVYVDDSWVGTPGGTDPDGAGPATDFGCDSFATIQGGVDGVTNPGTVLVAAGNYNEAQILVQKALTITGAGAAMTTINGGNTPIALAGLVRIDLPLIENGAMSFSGFTITNPGLTGGSRYNMFAKASSTLATITISNNIITGVNSADYGIYSDRPRGTVTFDHNSLTNNAFNPILIERPTGSTDFHHNTISGHSSTAYFNFTYGGQDVLTLQRFADNTISSSTLTAITVNGASNIGGGTGKYSSVQITNNVITGVATNRIGINLSNTATAGSELLGAIESPIVTGNRVTGTNAAGSKGIRLNGMITNADISNNNFRNLDRGISGEIFNTHSATGTQIHFNHIVGNTTGTFWDAPGPANAENNWWGCNFGPGLGGTGCTGTANGLAGANAVGVDGNPWYVLLGSASPTLINSLATSTVTADMTKNSAAATPLGSLPNVPVAYTATNGTMTPPADTIISGLDTSMFTSTNASSAIATITVDNQAVYVTINVIPPCTPPATVYVDDNWVGTIPGTDPDGAGPATQFGCDSFATIQGGVTGVTNPGTVLVSSGTYNEAQVLVQKALTITGAGAATTTINGGNTPIALAGLVRIDLPLTENGAVIFSGFTITNPGLTGGSRYNMFAKAQSTLATITISNNIIAGVNLADYGIYSDRPRGTVTFDHNTLTNNAFNPILIERPTGSTNFHHNIISGHSSTAYFNFTYGGQDVLTLQRFANNTVTGATASAVTVNGASNIGGGVGKYASVQITDNSITGLGATRVGISLSNTATAGSEALGAIESPAVTGNVITGTNIVGTSKGIRLNGLVTNAAITGNDVRGLNRGFSGEIFSGHSATGTQAHFNNFVGNTIGFQWDGPAATNAENNWWGCNAGPGNAGCNAVNGATDFDPWIVLGVSASPSSILPFATSTITADMRFNSNAVNVSGSGTIPPTPVSFSAVNGTMAPPAGTITAGQATSVFTSNSTNSGSACAMVDGQQVCTPITVLGPDLSVVKSNNVSGVRPVSGAWTWTFTVSNTGNTNAVFGAGQVVLRDNLPNTNITYGAPTTAANATCTINGTFDLVCTANAGGLTVIPAGGFTVTVPVNGASIAGTYVNPRGGGGCAVDPDNAINENANEGNNSCTDTVSVFNTQVVTKSFTPAAINVSGTSVLAITITNPAGNPGALDGLSFTDNFPAGMQVAATPAASNTCGGTFAPSATDTSITLSGGSILTPGNSCTVSVSVTSITAGAKLNSVTVSSNQTGAAAPATATLTVGRVPLDFDGDAISDYAVVRDSGLPIPNAGSASTASDSVQDTEPGDPGPPRDGTLGSMHRGYYFKLPGEKFDPLMPRIERPGDIEANQMRWLISTSGPGADLNILFGTLNDFPVPADYDGDGKCDIAVWTGGVAAQFRVLTSSSGFVTTLTYNLGNLSSDPSVVGDYDGDGKADPAIMDANTGQWTYLGGPTHATSVTVTPIGTFGGGFPVPGDFDGDSKYDFMLETRDGINPTQGHYYQWNNNGTLTPPATDNFVFGNYRDVVIPGDYDGDGKTDVGLASVIVNPIAWRVRLTPSGTLVGPVVFGNPVQDFPITGDYNGDQKGEITIWRPAGQFQSLLAPLYMLPTTDFSWGQSGDYPVAYFNSH